MPKNIKPKIEPKFKVTNYRSFIIDKLLKRIRALLHRLIKCICFKNQKKLRKAKSKKLNQVIFVVQIAKIPLLLTLTRKNREI